MIDGRNFFINQLKMIYKIKKHKKNIRKITTGQGDNYTTGCLLVYNYFKKHYKMLSIDLSKQQALDADPKAIKQINFTGNLSGNNNRLIFFIVEKVKETILDLTQGTVKSIIILFCFNIISI